MGKWKFEVSRLKGLIKLFCGQASCSLTSSCICNIDSPDDAAKLLITPLVRWRYVFLLSLSLSLSLSHSLSLSLSLSLRFYQLSSCPTNLVKTYIRLANQKKLFLPAKAILHNAFFSAVPFNSAGAVELRASHIMPAAVADEINGVLKDGTV
jgi:hypothetical protein